MEKSSLEKNRILKKRNFIDRLTIPLKRIFRIIGNESDWTHQLGVSKKGVSDIFVTYNQIQRINTQLLKLERQKAEAIQLIREKQRCL
jgi:hypothetical protein